MGSRSAVDRRPSGCPAGRAIDRRAWTQFSARVTWTDPGWTDTGARRSVGRAGAGEMEAAGRSMLARQSVYRRSTARVRVARHAVCRSTVAVPSPAAPLVLLSAAALLLASRTKISTTFHLKLKLSCKLHARCRQLPKTA